MAWTLLNFSESKVVRLVALGCSDREVAAILGISEESADNGRTSAMKKLGVHSAGTLARVAFTLGFTSLGDKLTGEELARLDADSSSDTALECEISQALPARPRRWLH
jgi:DNA-binding CsgD family transcriptional regulator